MEVILLERMANLGKLGDKVTVKPGYARNYLVPQGKAVPATKENLVDFEARRAELEKASADLLTAAQGRAAELDGKEVTIPANVGEEGKLFGSVSNREIAEALVAAGATVDKNELRMPDGAIRQMGEYEITVHLHADVDATVKVNVVSEQGAAEPSVAEEPGETPEAEAAEE